MIRKFKNKDAKLMAECLNDAAVTQYMQVGQKKSTQKSCLDFIRNSRQDQHNAHFAVVDENDNYVGSISLKNIDFAKRQAEYAVITCQNAHGKGYAMQATNQILKYAFDNLKLDRVYLNVVDENIRAIKFYQKCNFQQIKNMETKITIKGCEKKLIWFEMFKKQFESTT